jgi:hypothetical protein
LNAQIRQLREPGRGQPEETELVQPKETQSRLKNQEPEENGPKGIATEASRT